MIIQPLEQSLAECTEIISGLQTAVITAHVNPDGDAIGSELALFHLLRSLGKEVSVINSSPLPSNFAFLCGSELIREYSPEMDDAVIANADVLFILDCNAPKRIQAMQQCVAASSAQKVVVDHHLDPQPFADVYVVDTEASSTAEILWRLVARYGEQAYTQEIAEALYTGIHTDSGGFRHPRTDAELLRMAARLLDAGVDPTYIYEHIYNQGSVQRTRLLGNALSQLQVFHGGELCLMVVSSDMLQAASASETLTEGFVEHTLSLAGVRMGVLVVELPDMVKMSFRSKGTVSAKACAEYFGGGGHYNAAGARSTEHSIVEVLPRIVAVFREQLV